MPSLLILLNVQGLTLHKCDEINIKMQDKPANFICLTEVWANNNSIDTFKFKNYNLAANYCRSDHIHGGVALWANDNIDLRALDFSEFCTELDAEMCGVEWCNDGESIYIVLCYRSPSGNIDVFLDSLYRLLESIYCSKNKYYVLGDFNVQFQNKDDNNVFRLRNLLQTFNLHDIVKNSTRNNALLDNIFCAIEDGFDTVVSECYFSDHNLIQAYKLVNGTNEPTSKLYCRNYNKTKRLYFQNLLLYETWDDLFTIRDIDDAFSYFLNIYRHYFLSCFPVKLKTLHNKKSCWVNNAVKRSSSKLHDLFCIQKKYPELKDYYESQKRRHTFLKHFTKKSFYDNIILNSSNKTKGAWSAISQITGKKRKFQNISLQINDAETCNPRKIANEFNSFFISAPRDVITKITPPTTSPKSIARIPNSFCALPYSEEELLSVLKQIKNKKTADPDGISTYILNESISYIIKPIAYLINLSFSQGRFPKVLKLSAVSPVHKKDDKKVTSNYRPISISSCFAKVFEYAMLDRLKSHLKRNQILTPSQHGFRQGYSTISAIHTFINKLSESLDGGETPAAIFCDLSRAFDCVDHALLMDKLELYGVRGVTADWFISYLSGRAQYVQVMHKLPHGEITKFKSSLLPVNIGVPQGSILGPILFLLFVNDMVDSVDNFLTLYADDTAAIVSKKSLDDLYCCANTLLFQLNEWFSHNRLYMNPKKTHYTVFHTHQNKKDFNLNLKISSYTLKRETYAKFLGLQIDETLNWKKHCVDLVSHINTACFQVRALKEAISLGVMLSFYYAQIQCRLTYGIAFWGCSSMSDDVFTAQKRVIRCMAGIRRYESCRPHFKNFKILPLASLYILHLVKHVHENKQKYQKFSDIHSHNTRNKSLLYPPKNLFTITERTPFSMGIKLYNRLPEYIQSIPSIKIFKKTVKDLLIEKCVYTISEFYNMFKI